MHNPSVRFRFFRYVFWAVVTTGVSWCAYTVFANVLTLTPISQTALVTVSNIASWICAVTFSYIINRVRVFRSAETTPSAVMAEALKFYGSRLAVGVVETALVPFLIWLGVDGSFFGAAGLPAKIVSTPIIILMNYLIGRFFVFRRIKGGADTLPNEGSDCMRKA